MKKFSTGRLLIIAGIILVAVLLGMLFIRDKRVNTDVTSRTTRVGLIITGPKMEEYAKFKDHLSRIASDDEETDKPVAGPDLMKDAFEKIRSAAEEMDCDRLEEVFGSMSSFNIPDEHRELFKKLKEESERFEYDTILELMNT